ncbi:MAG: PilZ domain-containing protein [Gemmataceae bacterium]|nr:PilZ domain-containing protein [Gemmataceae bacterium]
MAKRKTPMPLPTAADRRAVVRHPCNGEAPFRAGDRCGTARLRDLSAGGIGMVLPHRVAPGGIVTVELRDRVHHSLRLKLVQVVHVAPHTDDSWLIGSAFTKPLSEEELHAVLPC